MKHSIKKVFTVVILTAITSYAINYLGERGEAKANRSYSSGYSDGYAEGYNTRCNIRSTLVGGYWDNEEYTDGYRDGRSAGVRACDAGVVH